MKLIDPRGGTIDLEKAKEEFDQPLLKEEQSVFLAELLAREEGLRLKPYRDIVGKLTIGFGRNLDDKGISNLEAEFMLYQDIEEVIDSLLRVAPWCVELLNVNLFGKFAVLVSLRFQLGEKGFLSFKRFLTSLKDHNFEEAAKHLMDSKAAKQCPERFERLKALLLS